MIRPEGLNPRGEYYLLENKQPVGSDTANMLTGGRTGPKKGGLLVWHIDSLQLAQGSPSNEVNVGAIHGVRLIEADGLDHLYNNDNRGDAGDPFPGSKGVERFSGHGYPASVLNTAEIFAGFALTSISSDLEDVAFDFWNGPAAVVTASDSNASITVNGEPHRRFEDVVPPGTALDIGIPQHHSKSRTQHPRGRY